jgi:hypothetical protein
MEGFFGREVRANLSVWLQIQVCSIPAFFRMRAGCTRTEVGAKTQGWIEIGGANLATSK